LMYNELYQKIRPYVSAGQYSPQTDARKWAQQKVWYAE
jgi:hypothetical protein